MGDRSAAQAFAHRILPYVPRDAIGGIPATQDVIIVFELPQLSAGSTGKLGDGRYSCRAWPHWSRSEAGRLPGFGRYPREPPFAGRFPSRDTNGSLRLCIPRCLPVRRRQGKGFGRTRRHNARDDGFFRLRLRTGVARKHAGLRLLRPESALARILIPERSGIGVAKSLPQSGGECERLARLQHLTPELAVECPSLVLNNGEAETEVRNVKPRFVFSGRDGRLL